MKLRKAFVAPVLVEEARLSVLTLGQVTSFRNGNLG